MISSDQMAQNFIYLEKIYCFLSLQFHHYYHSVEIRQIMIMLYLMIFNGENLIHFRLYFTIIIKVIIMDPQFYKNLFTISDQNISNSVQGGIFIALGSSLYYLLFGGILGMSGLAGSLIKFPTRQSTRAKAIVVAGIIFISALLNALFQHKKILHIPFDKVQFILASSTTRIIVSGMLVGIGTELSNGCTSGHGLCGMPRFSLRSFAAVLVFLSTAIVTATYSLGDHIPQIPELKLKTLDSIEINPLYYLGGCILATIILFVTQKSKPLIANIALFGIGIIFGCGLLIAGMSQRSKIYGFLQLNKHWDPSLLLVLMTGVIINIVTFNLIKKLIKQPLYGQKIEDPRGKLTLKLILGALLFGLGWGLGGLCPGPYLLSIPNSFKIAFYWGIPFFFSQKITNLIFGEGHKHHDHIEAAKTGKKGQ